MWPCSGVYCGHVKVGDVGREGARTWKRFDGVDGIGSSHVWLDPHLLW